MTPERKQAWARSKYRTDAEHRERCIARAREWRQMAEKDPLRRKRINLSHRVSVLRRRIAAKNRLIDSVRRDERELIRRVNELINVKAEIRKQKGKR